MTALARSDADDIASVDGILVTGALRVRPRRRPDHAAENRALVELARHMVERPEGLYQRFVELAVDLCRAGSAGISLLETTPAGEAIFRWTALAGAFAPYVGGYTPRDFSPCGICLDRGETILLDRPARRFRYFDAVDAPPIVEGLIVPLYARDRMELGTIWIVTHGAERRFDAEDGRVIGALGTFLALALEKDKLLRQKELLLRELQHRSRNNLQMISGLLALQRGKATDPVARRTLDDALARIETIARAQPEGLADAAATAGMDLTAVVRELCASLAAAGDGGGRIAFDIDVEGVRADPASVLPIALIVNELLTNAVKHAFPGSASGRIGVRMRRSAPGELTLRVTDDGAPLRDSVERLRTASLGFGLIEGLAAQQGGRVAYPEGASKTFTVILPVKTAGVVSRA